LGGRGTGPGVITLLLVLYFGALGSAALARDADGELAREFDAREYSDADKRYLQVGLTLEGDYVGLIDGRWGAGSQRALEAFAAQTGAPGAIVRNAHVVLLISRVADFLSRHDLAYRMASPLGHRFLAPPGAFMPDFDTVLDDLSLKSGGIRILTLRSSLPIALDLHAAFTADRLPAYTVRKAERLVTGFTGGPYLRSDPVAGGWSSIVVAAAAGADPRLVDVIAGSITLDRTADLLDVGGRIDALLAAATAYADGRSTLPGAPDTVPAVAPPAAGPTVEDTPADGSGTAFFVNNTDLVTARHVVEGCRAITLVDGTPIDVVAIHPTLDLALLSSPRRSRHWIAVHQTGNARLGQRVIALGYPFYGTITTALNSTGGNISAMVGLGDDPRQVTVTAPVHPGNSGGPLLALDGTVIGVVIATLDKIAVAAATGSLPENTSYAVTGTELLGFLEAEGTSLPRQDAEPAGFDAGIPDDMQQAVVPVFCHGGS
jgi:S1-C subfamily serine protease